jgi:Tfp pilus assembly protein PilZ
MADPSNERRRDARYHARFVVRFAKETDAARAFDTFSTNVSAGGLCLRSAAPHAVGEMLKIDLTAGDEALSLDGQVAWVRRDTVGVRFVNVRLPDRERLEALVERLRSEPD